MLEPLDTWKRTLEQLALTDKTDWVSRFAAWVGMRSTMKLELQGIMGPVLFTFQNGLFESRLRALMSTDKKPIGAEQFASAWQAAVQASQMVVMPGASLGAPTPATLWSAVTSLLDPPSILLAKARLHAELSRIDGVLKTNESRLPEAFRNAFLTLTASATGINSTYPFPAPLVAPFVPTR